MAKIGVTPFAYRAEVGLKEAFMEPNGAFNYGGLGTSSGGDQGSFHTYDQVHVTSNYHRRAVDTCSTADANELAIDATTTTDAIIIDEPAINEFAANELAINSTIDVATNGLAAEVAINAIVAMNAIDATAPWILSDLSDFSFYQCSFVGHY